jgi:O-acetyl-ADP-ribose deacetylase (regulator of RNase III)
MNKDKCRKALSILLIAFACLSNLLLSAQETSTDRGFKAATSSIATSLQTGPYYALIIGNQNYKYIGALSTPINDANELAKVLRERYGFRTDVRLDVNRDDILTALIEYRRKLPVTSNLLIYYAGHGTRDKDTEEAYWQPVDAKADNSANWISAHDITSYIKAIPSRHIIVVSDSCYSGAMKDVVMRGRPTSFDPRDLDLFLAKKLEEKSRTLLSSGGDEPVADGGGVGHSVFAQALLDGLRRMDEQNFTANELYTIYVNRNVAGRSNQDPHYFPLVQSGDEGGDFVFTQRPSETDEQLQSHWGDASSAFDRATENYKLGFATTDDVRIAHEELVQAALRACSVQNVKDCRIKIYKGALEEAQTLTSAAKDAYAKGLITLGALKRADLHETELRNSLQQEASVSVLSQLSPVNVSSAASAPLGVMPKDLVAANQPSQASPLAELIEYKPGTLFSVILPNKRRLILVVSALDAAKADFLVGFADERGRNRDAMTEAELRQLAGASFDSEVKAGIANLGGDLSRGGAFGVPTKSDIPGQTICITFGPTYRSDAMLAAARLAQAYDSCFALSTMSSALSLAFPAYNTRWSNYPADIAAPVVIERIISGLEHPGNAMLVTITLKGDEFVVYSQALAKRLQLQLKPGS